MTPNTNTNWFVLSLIKGKEKSTYNRIFKMGLEHLSPFCPEKKIKLRQKGGALKDSIDPLYPGYIFIAGEYNYAEAKKITSLPGAIKLLGKKDKPTPIVQDEKRMILSIVTDGVVEYSKAMKEGSKIKIISGPLKALEGKIISVDRRKQRAVVGLTLLNTIVKTTLSFEYIEE